MQQHMMQYDTETEVLILQLYCLADSLSSLQYDTVSECTCDVTVLYMYVFFVSVLNHD